MDIDRTALARDLAELRQRYGNYLGIVQTSAAGFERELERGPDPGDRTRIETQVAEHRRFIGELTQALQRWDSMRVDIQKADDATLAILIELRDRVAA